MLSTKQINERLTRDQSIDLLADVEHDRWAHWQQYLHDHGHLQPDGSLVIPAELVARWQQQIRTPYADLTPEEQQSDREQVLRYLPVVVEILRD